MNSTKLNFKWYVLQYVPFVGVAVLLTFATHEFIHYLTGELLGNDMVMNLNESYPSSGEYLKDWHFSIVTATAPLFTFLQAIAFYVILRRRNVLLLFPLLVSPVVMRCMALVFTFDNPNDEARLSHDAGLSVWTIPIIVCSLMMCMLYVVVKKNQYSKSFVFWSILLTLIFTMILIEFNQHFLA